MRSGVVIDVLIDGRRLIILVQSLAHIAEISLYRKIRKLL